MPTFHQFSCNQLLRYQSPKYENRSKGPNVLLLHCGSLGTVEAPLRHRPHAQNERL